MGFKTGPTVGPKQVSVLRLKSGVKHATENGETMGVFVRKYERARSAMLDLSESMQKKDGEAMGVCAQA